MIELNFVLLFLQPNSHLACELVPAPYPCARLQFAVGQGSMDNLGKMYYMYVLKSVNFDRFYTGFTFDLDKRLAEHNSGKTKSNTAFLLFMVVYTEAFETREEARKREK